MDFRPARSGNADGISRMLRDLVAAGKRKSGYAPGFVRDNYTDRPDRIPCMVAVDDDETILSVSSPCAPLARETRMAHQSAGVLPALLSARKPQAAASGRRCPGLPNTLAINAGIAKIEACIGETNQPALAYYEEMGFQIYASGKGAIRKIYNIAAELVASASANRKITSANTASYPAGILDSIIPAYQLDPAGMMSSLKL